MMHLKVVLLPKPLAKVSLLKLKQLKSEKKCKGSCECYLNYM